MAASHVSAPPSWGPVGGRAWDQVRLRCQVGCLPVGLVDGDGGRWEGEKRKEKNFPPGGDNRE